jgi:DNA-binding NarL/FixJ family response regulator
VRSGHSSKKSTLLCGCGSRNPDHLTPRQVDILVLIASGFANSRIALTLGVSTRTVDQHVATMLRRSGAQNRAELIARCFAMEILVADAGVWPPEWSGRTCLTPRRPRSSA